MVLKRRKFLKTAGLVLPLIIQPFNKLFSVACKRLLLPEENVSSAFKQNFKKINDRTWIGESFWGVPMEDWQIKSGRLEFIGKEKQSRLHILTYVLQKGKGRFNVKGDLGLLQKAGVRSSVGFTVGIKDSTDETNVKAACYYGKGISAGLTTSGYLFIADKKMALPVSFNYERFNLSLEGITTGNTSTLRLTVADSQNRSAVIDYSQQEDISGLVAIENKSNVKNGDTFWWDNIELSGDKTKHEAANSFGPILWAMYTMSDGIVKLSAQLPPVGNKDARHVEMQLLKKEKWIKADRQEVNRDSFTVHFRLENWNSSHDVPYRLVYHHNNKDHYYKGIIRQEPLDRPLRFGGLTCQHWSGYPYTPLLSNLQKQDPDILYFSGDQLYEENGGYPIKRQPEDIAVLSYLGKWYMFGWAFGNIMRDRPTICTPDDHDVFQGNLWGEGGRRVSFEEWEKVKDAHSGFVQTPNLINVVSLTQCGHLPDAYNNEPLPSGIITWFTNLNYGKVSFAIVSDRMFKSGPETIRSGSGRIDHVTEPLKPEQLASEKLNFMGNAQMQFLNNWIGTWEGTNMKVLLSQTLFSNVGTHHGENKMFLYGDMDSGGWPKHQRDEVIRTIRKACAFHINGDQHLPFMVQYSINEPRDGGWTFCTPAISTGYPRWGEPDTVNMPFTQRPEHNLPNTGCYKDVFGNNNFIYAVGNPDDSFLKEKNRYIRARKKASGFGIITFNTKDRTIKMDAYRFPANKDIPEDDDQFPGWPLTINQSDNDGRKPLGYLPQLRLKKSDQLIKILKEDNKELVHVMRINGSVYIPPVYHPGKYTLVIGEGKEQKLLKEIEIAKSPEEILDV